MSTQEEEKKKKRESSKTQKVMTAVGMAAIDRLGNDSPASVVATDTYLLREIARFVENKFKFFVACGGFDSEAMKEVEVYSIKENVWSRGRDLPDPRYRHGMALAEDGRIFIFGGVVDYRITNSVLAIEDPMKGEWEVMPKMIEDRKSTGVGVVGDKIFVFGGFDDDKFISTCEVFSTTEDKWVTTTTTTTRVEPMPTPRNNIGVAVIGHLIFAIGGFNEGALATAEVLDTRSGTWSTLPPMPTPRSAMAVAVIDDRFIWTLGGYCGGPADVIEVFDVEKNKWSTPPIKLTSPRNGARAVTVGHKIFIICGQGPAGVLDDVEVLDTETMTWSKVAPMAASSRSWISAVGF